MEENVKLILCKLAPNGAHKAPNQFAQIFGCNIMLHGVWKHFKDVFSYLFSKQSVDLDPSDFCWKSHILHKQMWQIGFKIFIKVVFVFILTNNVYISLYCISFHPPQDIPRPCLTYLHFRTSVISSNCFHQFFNISHQNFQTTRSGLFCSTWNILSLA